MYTIVVYRVDDGSVGFCAGRFRTKTLAGRYAKERGYSHFDIVVLQKQYKVKKH